VGLTSILWYKRSWRRFKSWLWCKCMHRSSLWWCRRWWRCNSWLWCWSKMWCRRCYRCNLLVLKWLKCLEGGLNWLV